MNSGFFITIDGGDGAGKSHQAAKLRDSLEAEGYSVFLCRDPGTTRLGEAVREILLNREEIPIAPQSEMLLFMAARAEMISENILPALEEGKIVIADRFLLSTLVYQGIAGGLALEEIMRVGEVAVQGRFPDLTILLDISAEAARLRLARPLDRIEKKGLEFHKKVESGYREALRFLAAAGRGGTVMIDADGSPDEIAALIRREVKARLPVLKSESR
ncbi:MAG: dTMP kinase [Thermoguttaceae bacterium]|nr:dTMP kinase [Thermoguttaceae bacterium]